MAWLCSELPTYPLPGPHPGFEVGGPVDDLSTIHCQGSSGFRIAALHADQSTYVSNLRLACRK
jgi:hypothetical protein